LGQGASRAADFRFSGSDGRCFARSHQRDELSRMVRTQENFHDGRAWLACARTSRCACVRLIFKSYSMSSTGVSWPSAVAHNFLPISLAIMMPLTLPDRAFVFLHQPRYRDNWPKTSSSVFPFLSSITVKMLSLSLANKSIRANLRLQLPI